MLGWALWRPHRQELRHHQGLVLQDIGAQLELPALYLLHLQLQVWLCKASAGSVTSDTGVPLAGSLLPQVEQLLQLLVLLGPGRQEQAYERLLSVLHVLLVIFAASLASHSSLHMAALPDPSARAASQLHLLLVPARLDTSARLDQ